MKKIFAINLGSTSTKVAYYIDDKCVHKASISHDYGLIRNCRTVYDQKDFRESTIQAYMESHEISMDEIDAFVSRGGQTEPIDGGVYEINEPMLQQIKSGDYGTHVSGVGCIIAYELTRGKKALPLTAYTPTTDEFEDIARFSGLKEIERISSFQALNHKAMAKYYAESIGKKYEEMNLLVVMLGGGISVVAHKKGRMVDGPDALEGEGPFSNNRCCTVPVGPLVRLCYSGKYTREEMLRHINGEAGLISYLDTTDIREIEKRIHQGDEYAKQILEAMCYQTAKDIGAYATVLRGDVDAILLIGGMANSKFITQKITERVEFIAPVVVIPGEREMETLCSCAYDALCGRAEIKKFVPKEDM